ncbi:MAG: DUF3347 domain-containing protein [Chitinophagaceae bacterium]|nr:DUF3347 domain-containing protein [Chitinophagaceae bacterium]
MKSLNILLTASFLLVSAAAWAQIRNAKTETVKIEGNCGMCETTIEKAGNVKKVASVEWNKDTKTALLTYDATKTNADEILKRIALAGYDNEKYRAPDEVYAKLHGCCQYERSGQAAANITEVPGVSLKNHSGHMNTMQEAPKAVTENHEGHMEHAAEIQSASKLQGIFAQYFSLKDALIQSDGGAAASAAQSLRQSVLTLKMEELNGAEHTAWMAAKNALALEAERIAGTKELGRQRDYFASLSTHMYTLLKASKQEETVYYQHCPMYNKGKGANWLSKESEIRNPYYGAQMLGCGKTVEAIK